MARLRLGRLEEPEPAAGSSGSGTLNRIEPVAWGLVLGLIGLKLIVHLLSNGPLAYGYFGDELYYLACARRLAWGYVDHPPLAVALLRLVSVTLGDSLLALRLLPTLGGCATIALVALIARELGGGRAAQGLAALAALVAPLYLAVTGGLYSVNALDPAFWALSAYLVVRILRGADRRIWLLLGIVMGLGLLNKISILWFGFGFFVGLILTPERRWFLTPWPWLAGVISFAFFVPYIAWQVQHDWPTLEFMRNALQYKMATKPPLTFIVEQATVMNPVILPVWLAGLGYYFIARAGRPYRLLGWIWVCVFLLLLTSGKARSNYIGPAYSILLASGGVALERLGQLPGWRRLPHALAALVAIGGAAAAPMAIPLLPPDSYVRYERAIGLSAPKDQRDRLGALPMHFAQRFGWQQLTAAVAEAYGMLTPEEQMRAGVLAYHDDEAGAIDVLGRAAGLPYAISPHNNYWLWGPGDYTGEVMLVISDSNSALREIFEQVERAAVIECQYCMPSLRRKSVFICRHIRRPLRDIWPELKEFI